MTFIDWLVQKGQEYIANFKIEGETLFFSKRKMYLLQSAFKRHFKMFGLK